LKKRQSCRKRIKKRSVLGFSLSLNRSDGWDYLFARSHDILAEMAAEVIREDEAGLTQPLDPDEM
jgi:hypothetical protein